MEAEPPLRSLGEDEESTKGWSTAGLQGNREQTRSNTLLLTAAWERQDSGRLLEISLLKCGWAERRNLPSLLFMITETTSIFILVDVDSV